MSSCNRSDKFRSGLEGSTHCRQLEYARRCNPYISSAQSRPVQLSFVTFVRKHSWVGGVGVRPLKQRLLHKRPWHICEIAYAEFMNRGYGCRLICTDRVADNKQYRRQGFFKNKNNI